MAENSQRKTLCKPNFFLMLVKYPDYFTGGFNWISLSIAAVLIFDVPLARAVNAGDFAWYFALIFVAALFLGVPFALYITFLDYGLAISCYEGEKDKHLSQVNNRDGGISER